MTATDAGTAHPPLSPAAAASPSSSPPRPAARTGEPTAPPHAPAAEDGKEPMTAAGPHTASPAAAAPAPQDAPSGHRGGTAAAAGVAPRVGGGLRAAVRAPGRAGFGPPEPAAGHDAGARPTAGVPAGAGLCARLTGLARESGLRVLAGGEWPEGAEDGEVPVLPGFVGSSFSPLAAEVAGRCLGRRAGGAPVAGTGVVVVSALGDLEGAVRVAEAVDGGGAPGPLAFFQAVPNAVAGHVTARWGLFGPVVCVADCAAGVEVAALLVEDGDADEVLLIRVEQAATAGARDRAAAVLLSGGDTP